MDRSWDNKQTSSREEDDLEQEGYSPASIRERLRLCCDWTSIKEDPKEPPFEVDEEEHDEKGKKLMAIPINAIKFIIDEDKLDFVKDTPTVMGKCGFSNCTIHDPLDESSKIDPRSHGMHTIGARM